MTKYRNEVINDKIKRRLKEVANEIFIKYDCEVLGFNGEEDHIHILFSATPNINLSKLINVYKTTSSRYVRKEYHDHINKFYWRPYFWSRGYLILSSGGAPIEKIKKYIENQGQDREG